MPGSDLIQVVDAGDLAKPDPVGIDDLFGGFELPHRPVGRHTSNRKCYSPEFHSQPERPDLRGHQSDVKVANAIHRIDHVDHTEVFVELAEFKGIERRFLPRF